ncbi:MAG: class I SAM-dependent methyltransferase [Nevskiales bacterium]
MNPYERFILPYLLDFACGIKPIHMQRDKVLPQAHGKVLEVGIGTGLNMAHYDKQKVEKIWGLDPALQMHRLAAKRIAKAGLNVELLGLPAEKIPMDDASFDSIVCTYTLCTIPDPLQALDEMRRVLKPGGKLIFCEHGKAPDAKVARWQQRLNPIWKPLAGGCNLDRPVPKLLEQGGFEVSGLETMYLPGPRPLTFNYWGTATAR